jgi:cation diffusion facilitator CzcD-associated flavoprotein CzcO
VDAHGLGPHLRLHTAVIAATWNDDDATWDLELSDGEVVTADVVVSGLGQLNLPHIPDIEGLERFEGTVFHSARWNHDHDLAGERVAVIGIGASAIQFVPQVAKDAGQLTLFQRSVNYVAPKPDRPYRPWERWVLRHVPVVRKAYRASIYWRFEARFALMRKGNRLGRMLQERFGKEISPLVSDRLPAEALVPDYTPGCRRILIANDWYPTLLRPNVEVVTDGVAEITEHSVRTDDGREFEVDTIIFGTGFRSTEFLAPLRITGRGGTALEDVWRDGARAYLGLAVPEFPNLFMLYGPNTNNGSIITMIEYQVEHIVAHLRRMRDEGLDWVDVRPEPMARFNDEVQAAIAGVPVWNAGCNGYYRTPSGRIVTQWPFSMIEFRDRTAVVDPDVFESGRRSEPCGSTSS